MLDWGFISVRGCLPGMLEILGVNYSVILFLYSSICFYYFLVTCTCLFLSVGMCMCVIVPAEARGVRYLGAGVTGACEQSSESAGDQAQALCTNSMLLIINHHSSPSLSI